MTKLPRKPPAQRNARKVRAKPTPPTPPEPTPEQRFALACAYILDQLSEGRPLKDILKDTPSEERPTVPATLPSRSTFMRAVLADHDGLWALHARAREVGAWEWADEIREISDQSERDTLVDDKGNERANHEWISRSKLRVDTRKWLLSKLLPKTFGEKLDVTSDGKAMASPIAMLPSEMLLTKPSE